MGRHPSPPDDWDELEAVVIAFEAGWAAGVPPRIEDYLPSDGPHRRRLLNELVHADLEFRLKRGEAARVEGYLAAHPELGDSPGGLHDLIGTEWAIRSRQEPAPSIVEYQARFPDHAPALERLDPRPWPVRRGPVERPEAAAIIPIGPLPRRFGKYELRQRVGEGSFGLVFRAWDTVLEREVAVKIRRPDDSGPPRDSLDFFREARNAIHLRHPNIVAIHDAGPVDGTVCLISEFVDGMTLAERLRIGSPTVAESTHLMVQVLEALAHAHHRGIVHRDLKPSPILLDGDGMPHLTDFGLAKRSTGDTTLSPLGASQVLIGTPAYMAPEQARGDSSSVDARSDVYAAGVLLYELLTGGVPFRGRGRLLQVQIEAAEPIPPRQLNDEIPPDLETICLRALSKVPAERYQSASGMADDLASFRAGRPIVARRSEPRAPSFWVRRRRGLRRGAIGLAVAASALTLILHWRALDRRIDRDTRLIEQLVRGSIRAADLPFRAGTDAGEEHRRLKVALGADRHAWVEALAGRAEFADLRADVLLQEARQATASGDDAAAGSAWAWAIAALEAASGDRDGSMQRRVELARALMTLAAIESRASRRDAARALAERSASTWGELAGAARDRLARNPRVTTLRLDLAEAILRRDQAIRVAHGGSPDGAVIEAEEIAEAMPEAGPLQPDEWSRLGTIQWDLAARQRSFGHLGAAVSWSRQAFQSFEASRALDDTPAANARSGRAAMLLGLVDSERQPHAPIGSARGASAMLGLAIRSLGAAVAADPTDLDARGDLAAAEAGLARLLARSERSTDAAALLRTALERARSVCSLRPRSPDDLVASAEIRAGLARVEWSQGNLKPAIVQGLAAWVDAQQAARLAAGEPRYRQARDARAAELLGRLRLPCLPPSARPKPDAPGVRHAEVELH